MSESSPKSRLLKKIALLPIIVITGLAGIWLALSLAPNSEAIQEVKSKQSQIKALHSWRQFPKQGPNECGAFSLSYGLKLVLNQENNPKDMVGKVSHSVAWSEGLSGTVPWKITAEAAAQGLQAQQYSALSHPPDQRLGLLCHHVSEQSPVIVLINSDRGVQHYILVVGFDEESIHIYDPAIDAEKGIGDKTADQNGSKAGNRSYTRARFQEVWGQGGMVGLYRWWYLPLKKRAGKK
ncbi:MAG: papain-like cysteine protease family protein [Planctomycetota bacterium]|nr:papain-like cysteine protease family protein [Planctomycetota bacterium]